MCVCGEGGFGKGDWGKVGGGGCVEIPHFGGSPKWLIEAQPSLTALSLWQSGIATIMHHQSQQIRL